MHYCVIPKVYHTSMINLWLYTTDLYRTKALVLVNDLNSSMFFYIYYTKHHHHKPQSFASISIVIHHLLYHLPLNLYLYIYIPFKLNHNNSIFVGLLTPLKQCNANGSQSFIYYHKWQKKRCQNITFGLNCL